MSREISPPAHKKDTIGQVFPGEQIASAHGLLTQLHESYLAEAGWAFGLH